MKRSYFILPGLRSPVNTPTELINTICSILKISVDHLKGKVRKREYVDARFMAAYFLHQEFKETHHLTIIANMIGYPSHSSAVHGIKKALDYRDSDQTFREKFNEIDKFIKNGF